MLINYSLITSPTIRFCAFCFNGNDFLDLSHLPSNTGRLQFRHSFMILFPNKQLLRIFNSTKKSRSFASISHAHGRHRSEWLNANPDQDWRIKTSWKPHDWLIWAHPAPSPAAPNSVRPPPCTHHKTVTEAVATVWSYLLAFLQIRVFFQVGRIHLI